MHTHLTQDKSTGVNSGTFPRTAPLLGGVVRLEQPKLEAAGDYLVIMEKWTFPGDFDGPLNSVPQQSR